MNIGTKDKPVFRCDAQIKKGNKVHIIMSFRGKNKKVARKRVSAILFSALFPKEFNMWKEKHPDMYKSVEDLILK